MGYVGDELGRGGRPRSEEARTAILHAVDDLLVEVGYSELTMKGIAERAGVGRQTVYRWWSTKAEVLFEAAITDAARELQTPPSDDTGESLTSFVAAVTRFLTTSDAGAGYRALIGEAQHDAAVAASFGERFQGPLRERERALLALGVEAGELDAALDVDAALDALCGPVFYRALTGRAIPRAFVDGLRG